LSRRPVPFLSSPGGRRDLLSFPPRRSSDLVLALELQAPPRHAACGVHAGELGEDAAPQLRAQLSARPAEGARHSDRDRPLIRRQDRKSTRLNSSHVKISYAVFCLKKKTDTR